MATDSAPVSTESATPLVSLRQIWQLPLFVLGLAAAISAYKCFPVVLATAQEQRERDRLSLIQILASGSPSLSELRDLCKRLDDQIPAGTWDTTTLAALGQAHVILAERDESVNASEHWRLALSCFEPCKADAIADAQDRARFVFRRAKTIAANGQGEPVPLITVLERLPAGEENGERQRLLGETYLRLSPPDLHKAKAELSAYLSGLPRGSASSAAKLRLQVAQLCLQTGEADRAKSWLSEISEQAPPDTVAQARIQLAQIALKDRDVSEAVKLFESTEQLKGVSPEQRSDIRYQTGQGLATLGNLKAAKDFLMKAREPAGDAATAARIRLADLYQREANPQFASEELSKAFPSTTVPSTYKNPYVSLAEVRTIFEATVQSSRGANDFETATRTADLYRVVAEPGRDRELYADALAAWSGVKGVEDPRGKLALAGTEFVKLAELRTGATEQAKVLQQAHSAFVAAGDVEAAEKVLKKLAGLNGSGSEALAESNLKKGQSLLLEGRYSDAADVFKPLKKTPGSLGLRATVKWAFAEVKAVMKLSAAPSDTIIADRVQAAMAELATIANKTYEQPEERLAHEEALYYLGRYLIDKSLPKYLNYADAESRLRRLVQEYPQGPFVEKGKLFLGVCLCSQAREPKDGGQLPADAIAKLGEAKDLFQALDQSKDEWIRMQACIRKLQTMLFLKQYDAIADECTVQQERHRGTAAELVILNLLHSSQLEAKRPDLARNTAEQIRKAYESLPDSAYSNEMLEFTKAYWTKHVSGK